MLNYRLCSVDGALVESSHYSHMLDHVLKAALAAGLLRDIAQCDQVIYRNFYLEGNDDSAGLRCHGGDTAARRKVSTRWRWYRELLVMVAVKVFSEPVICLKVHNS